MKRVINILLVLGALQFASCGKDYTYKWEVEVTYINGDSEILGCEYTSFNGNECGIYLSTSRYSPEPCLVIRCGGLGQNIACGVRKFRVISSDKIPIE